MNTLIESASPRIEAREIPDSERLDILPRHFGRHMLIVEHAVYAFMRRLSRDYVGGHWSYVETSNGGFYMSPSQAAPFNIKVDSNQFEGSMSADAAGITACLFCFSHLSFQIQDECIANHFHWLRDFALDHAEASAILAAID